MTPAEAVADMRDVAINGYDDLLVGDQETGAPAVDEVIKRVGGVEAVWLTARQMRPDDLAALHWKLRAVEELARATRELAEAVHGAIPRGDS